MRVFPIRMRFFEIFGLIFIILETNNLTLLNPFITGIPPPTLLGQTPVVVGRKILLVGGEDKEGYYRNDVYWFDPGKHVLKIFL